jgi:hypothetical protein
LRILFGGKYKFGLVICNYSILIDGITPLLLADAGDVPRTSVELVRDLLSSDESVADGKSNENNTAVPKISPGGEDGSVVKDSKTTEDNTAPQNPTPERNTLSLHLR